MVLVSMVVEGLDVTFVKKLKTVRKTSGVCERWSFTIWTEEKCLKEKKKFPKRVGRCFGRGFIREVIRYRDCCLADCFAEKLSRVVSQLLVGCREVMEKVVAEWWR